MAEEADGEGVGGVEGVEVAEVVAETQNRRTKSQTRSPLVLDRLVRRGNGALNLMVVHRPM